MVGPVGGEFQVVQGDEMTVGWRALEGLERSAISPEPALDMRRQGDTTFIKNDWESWEQAGTQEPAYILDQVLIRRNQANALAGKWKYRTGRSVNKIPEPRDADLP